MSFQVLDISVAALLGAEELEFWWEEVGFGEGEGGVRAHEGVEEGDEDGVGFDLGGVG